MISAPYKPKRHKGEIIMKYQEYLEKAKALIRSFWEGEYGDCDESDFNDLAHIPLAYTTITDAEMPIEVFIDLENRRLESYAGDNVLIEVINFNSFEDVITQCEVLSFDDLVSFDDSVLNGALAQWKEAVVC